MGGGNPNEGAKVARMTNKKSIVDGWVDVQIWARFQFSCKCLVDCFGLAPGNGSENPNEVTKV